MTREKLMVAWKERFSGYWQERSILGRATNYARVVCEQRAGGRKSVAASAPLTPNKAKNRELREKVREQVDEIVHELGGGRDERLDHIGRTQRLILVALAKVPSATAKEIVPMFEPPNPPSRDAARNAVARLAEKGLVSYTEEGRPGQLAKRYALTDEGRIILGLLGE